MPFTPPLQTPFQSQSLANTAEIERNWGVGPTSHSRQVQCAVKSHRAQQVLNKEDSSYNHNKIMQNGFPCMACQGEAWRPHLLSEQKWGLDIQPERTVMFHCSLRRFPSLPHITPHTLRAVDDGRIGGVPENSSMELGGVAGSADKWSINYIQGQLMDKCL